MRPRIRLLGLIIAAGCAGVLAATLAVPAAVGHPGPGEQPGHEHGTKLHHGDPILRSLRAVPRVTGPLPQTRRSYPFSTMRKAKEPVDLRDYGYVENEFFLSGNANVYDDASGRLKVVEKAVPYTNRILVRRPAKKRDSSGVVLVDIYNASNGYDVEDHWRRMWGWAMAEGHTYIGVTSKPINVDALKNFDPRRYAALTWDVSDVDRDPIIAVPGQPFDPFQVVPGAEEGLAWDILTQVGTLLDSRHSRRVLGGQRPETVLLMGQSQSGIYLNTYTEHFHDLIRRANGENLFDGYLNSVGAVLNRPLRQQETGGLVTEPGAEPNFDVPFITVTSEGDAALFGTQVLAENPRLGPNRRHWQVAGTPHTDILSPVVPQDEEVLRSGRLPRTGLTPEFIATLNPYPLEPTIIAAAEALVDWAEDGTPAAPSLWFDQAGGTLVRDADGNVTGGVRYGLSEYPLATFRGASAPGSVYGSFDLISLDEFTARYGTREHYLALVSAYDARQIDAGYLTQHGAEQFQDVAEDVLDRIGVDGG